MNFLTFVREMGKLASDVYGVQSHFHPLRKTVTIHFSERGAASSDLINDCERTLMDSGYLQYAETDVVQTRTDIAIIDGKVAYSSRAYDLVVTLTEIDASNTTGLIFSLS